MMVTQRSQMFINSYWRWNRNGVRMDDGHGHRSRHSDRYRSSDGYRHRVRYRHGHRRVYRYRYILDNGHRDGLGHSDGIRLVDGHFDRMGYGYRHRPVYVDGVGLRDRNGQPVGDLNVPGDEMDGPSGC